MDWSAYLLHLGFIPILFLFVFGVMGILPVPEETYMIVMGVLIAHGSMKYATGLSAAFLGTVIGMTSAYMLGRWLGPNIIRKVGRKIGISDERWTKLEAWNRKHGKWTLLFGYFVPVFRLLTAYSAGIGHMSYRRFAIGAYTGAAMWTFLFVTVGVMAGKGWHMLSFIHH
ncbi:hypothetical protein GCM10020370_72120 [Paenibacillus hodogayensis]